MAIWWGSGFVEHVRRQIRNRATSGHALVTIHGSDVAFLGDTFMRELPVPVVGIDSIGANQL